MKFVDHVILEWQKRKAAQAKKRRGRVLQPIMPQGPSSTSFNGQRLIVYDLFNDTDNTPIGNHVPDINYPGGAWINVNSAIKIVSNTARLTGSGVQSGFGLIPCASNAAISLYFDFDPSVVIRSASLVFRYSNSTSFWYAQANHSTLGNSHSISLVKYQNNIAIPMLSADTTIDWFSPYLVTVICSADLIKIYGPGNTFIPDAPLLSLRDDYNISSPTCGFWLSQSSTGQGAQIQSMTAFSV